MKLDEEMKMGLHKLLDSMNELYGVGYKESGPFEAFIVRSIEPYQEGNKYMVNIDIIHNQNHYYYVDPWREEIPNLYEPSERICPCCRQHNRNARAEPSTAYPVA